MSIQKCSLRFAWRAIHDQILEGSHKCGRIDHGPVGGQVGADLERVEQLKKRLEHHYVEMEPGEFKWNPS